MAGSVGWMIGHTIFSLIFDRFVGLQSLWFLYLFRVAGTIPMLTMAKNDMDQAKMLGTSIMGSFCVIRGMSKFVGGWPVELQQAIDGCVGDVQ